MSKSYLHDPYMKKRMYDEDDRYVYAKHGHNERNPHRRDEMPKNRPSKLIYTHCRGVEYLNDVPNFQGHKPRRGGHTTVSGIVRSKLKNEFKQEIENELN